MDVYKFGANNKSNLDDFKKGSTLLLGEFEVFHKGHNELLKKARDISKNEKIGILLIENYEKKILQTLENKLDNLANLNFDFVIIAQFNFEFKSIEGNIFIRYLDENFNVKNYVVGSDFKFGKDRKFSAVDLKNITKSNVEIVDILKINEIKISSSDIKQMHEFGEYNLISNLVINPLVFDVEIDNKVIKWDDKIVKPHFGNYYFQILIDDYWYHGLINFSINNDINYYLVNYDKNKEIFNQKSKIKILNIERIITNNRFDKIDENDIKKTIEYFSV